MHAHTQCTHTHTHTHAHTHTRAHTHTHRNPPAAMTIALTLTLSTPEPPYSASLPPPLQPKESGGLLSWAARAVERSSCSHSWLSYHPPGTTRHVPHTYHPPGTVPHTAYHLRSTVPHTATIHQVPYPTQQPSTRYCNLTQHTIPQVPHNATWCHTA